MRTIQKFLILGVALTFPLAAQQPRVVTPGFIALNAASLGAAALDVASTRRCIDAGTCHEMNPLMKCSAGCQYSRALGEAAEMGVLSYEMKKHGHRGWWVAPTIEIGMHGVLAGANLRF